MFPNAVKSNRAASEITRAYDSYGSCDLCPDISHTLHDAHTDKHRPRKNPAFVVFPFLFSIWKTSLKFGAQFTRHARALAHSLGATANKNDKDRASVGQPLRPQRLFAGR